MEVALKEPEVEGLIEVAVLLPAGRRRRKVRAPELTPGLKEVAELYIRCWARFVRGERPSGIDPIGELFRLSGQSSPRVSTPDWSGAADYVESTRGFGAAEPALTHLFVMRLDAGMFTLPFSAPWPRLGELMTPAEACIFASQAFAFAVGKRIRAEHPREAMLIELRSGPVTPREKAQMTLLAKERRAIEEGNAELAERIRARRLRLASGGRIEE